jgi:hypothetical protein
LLISLRLSTSRSSDDLTVRRMGRHNDSTLFVDNTVVAREVSPVAESTTSPLGSPSTLAEKMRRPYGFSAIKEVLRFVISLLNPFDHHNTDTMRLIALTVLHHILLMGGGTLSTHETLLSLLGGDGCKHIFQVSFISHYCLKLTVNS